MLLMLTALAALSIGYDLTRFIWPAERERMYWAERALYASLLGISLWIASAWLIAFADVLTRPVMLARTVLFVIAAVTLRIRSGDLKTLAQRKFEPKTVALVALPLLPLFLWCIFILWRSMIVPPLSHDALSGHLTKAALWVQGGGYDDLKDLAFMILPRPSNYEMLLADVIALQGGDVYTEWLSTIFYVLFIIATVAMAQRWWGDDTVMSVAVALVAGAVPVLLLQSGADKNDIMTGFFMAAGAVAGGRWIASSDLRALALCIVAAVAAAGTKQHGPVLAVFLAPFLAARMFRFEWTRKRVLALIGVTLLATLLLGAGVYYFGIVERRIDRAPAAATSTAPTASADSGGSSRYGDWSNLWIGPWALLTGPFTTKGALFVPGHGLWYWRRYEIYFSHLGIQCVLAAVALIPAILRYRKQGTPDEQRERMVVTLATLAAFVAILPVRATPFGIHAMNLPRFVLFIVPVLLSCTIAPIVLELARRNLGKPVLAAASITFVLYAVDNALHDTFVPPSYIEWATRHPGTRVVPFDPNRAAVVVDRIAGPRDVIAIDGASSNWTYPAFGAKLTRRVIFLPRRSDGDIQVPAEAKWVVVDRSWKVIWGDRRFQSLSQAGKYLARGALPAADLAVLRKLHADERFITVWANPRTLQAVFVRRDALTRRGR